MTDRADRILGLRYGRGLEDFVRCCSGSSLPSSHAGCHRQLPRAGRWGLQSSRRSWLRSSGTLAYSYLTRHTHHYQPIAASLHAPSRILSFAWRTVCDNRMTDSRARIIRCAGPIRDKLVPMAVSSKALPWKFVIAGALVVAVIVWIAFSAGEQAKSYYVTIAELQQMGNKAYTTPSPRRRQRQARHHRARRHQRHLHPRRARQDPPRPVPGRRAPARHLQGRRPGPRDRHLRPRRRLPRHPAPGQVRLQVRPRQTRRHPHRQHRPHGNHRLGHPLISKG